MQESKYLQLIQTLSKSERTAFKKYLYNFYGNRSKVIAIYTYVDKFKKDKFQHPKLADAYVREKVFNTPTYEGKGLSNPLSALNLYLEEFLRWQKIRHTTDSYEKSKMQLDIYRERKLDQAFFQEASALKDRIQTAPLDMWRHLKLAEIESSIHYNQSSLKLTKKEIALPAFRYHLKCFYEDVLMKTSCEINQRLEILEQNDNYTEVAENNFYKAYQLLKRLIDQKDEKTFEEAKTFAFEKLAAFGDEDFSVFITHLINYCKLREDTINIANALLKFEAKEYDHVFFLLNTVKALDLDHALRTRWLLLCTHFEKHPKSQQFKNYCKAYKLYFNRHKTIHASTKEGSLNLLEIVKKMTRPYDKKALKDEIINTNLLIYRFWLLKKVVPTFQMNEQ